MMSPSSLFSPEELNRIEQAVKRAEERISGEIVPVFVPYSDEYEIGNLRAGVAFSFLSALVWLGFYEFRTGWDGHWIFSPELLLILMAVSFTAAFFAARSFFKFRLLFLLPAEKSEAADRRAQRAFLEQNVFQTRYRTGILIFISEAEHRAEVLGDTGISAKVSPEEWEHVLHYILDGMRQKNKAEGICAAVEAAGELLLKKGFPKEADDQNELSDNIRG
jgi:putative membrane protein